MRNLPPNPDDCTFKLMMQRIALQKRLLFLENVLIVTVMGGTGRGGGHAGVRRNGTSAGDCGCIDAGVCVASAGSAANS